MGLLDILVKRGLLTSIYPESAEFRDRLAVLLSREATVYTGFDATAPSLHVGNLATIINSLYFQAHGHRTIYVIGDATTKIGDPSGHSKDRLRLDSSEIEKNASSIEQTLRQIVGNFSKYFLSQTSGKLFNLDNVSMKEPIIVRNSDWYRDENVIDFVSDNFRDIRVGWLLHKKSIQERLKSKEGMNAAEFCYQIFQANDWLQLYKRYNCQIQIGGFDQSGNIYTGHDLIKRRCGSKDSFGLLAPLITQRGKKLGKSASKSSSGIWLRSEQTSPFDLYQFFHRTPDDEVKSYLPVFSFYEDDVIDNFISQNLKNPSDIWFCQRMLAKHACLLVHGEDGLKEAEEKTASVFSRQRKV